MTSAARQRSDAFCARFGLQRPVLLSPMAGACPVALSRAVIEAGGMGAMGAVLSPPHDIGAWMDDLRAAGGKLLLSVELFGSAGAPYFAVACALSYLLSGYCGLYSSQTILYSKLRAEFINVRTHE